MATIASSSSPRPPAPRLAPDRMERFLSIASAVLLAAVLAAIARGRHQWGAVPPFVWAHLATMIIALALTPVMLLRPRGTRSHRQLGYVWAGSMLLTALLSFGIRGSNQGHLSFIHILSAWVVVQVPVIVWSARTHNVARHRGAVRGMVIGALLVAGFFTFPFHRLMGSWLFG